MLRLYKITKNQDGTDHPSVDEYTDVIQAEGNFEFQKGLAMENKSFAFLMLIDSMGEIYANNSMVYIATVGEGTITPRLIEIKTTTEETAKSYPHADVDAALADFYKRLGAAKQNSEVKAEVLRVIDETGNPHEYTYWVRPIEPTVE